MHLQVRLFAGAAEACASRRVALNLPAGTTAEQLLRALADRGGPLLLRCALAVDRKVVAPDAVLLEGADLAVLPPVSGGAAWGVGPEPLLAGDLLAAVADADLGATVLFVGTVRGSTDGAETVRLEYEAYEAMALDVLRSVADRAGRLWPSCRVAIRHRTGVVEPGAAAVGVAAAAAHRGDAFAAARFVIERCKAELPVWKKDLHPDGTSRWIDHP